MLGTHNRILYPWERESGVQQYLMISTYNMLQLNLPWIFVRKLGGAHHLNCYASIQSCTWWRYPWSCTKSLCNDNRQGSIVSAYGRRQSTRRSVVDWATWRVLQTAARFGSCTNRTWLSICLPISRCPIVPTSCSDQLRSENRTVIASICKQRNGSNSLNIVHQSHNLNANITS